MEFGMQLTESGRWDVDDLAGGSVSVMLGEVQNKRSSRNLCVGRSLTVELVLPVSSEAKVVDVEFVCFLTVEDSQDRNGGVSGECHEAILSVILGAQRRTGEFPLISQAEVAQPAQGKLLAA